MTNEEAFKQLVKFKNSLLMDLQKVDYYPTLNNESPIEFIYIALEALEKQIPKKLASDRQCPTCGTDAYANSYDAIKYNFCDNCGQRLDWGD